MMQFFFNCLYEGYYYRQGFEYLLWGTGVLSMVAGPTSYLEQKRKKHLEKSNFFPFFLLEPVSQT